MPLRLGTIALLVTASSAVGCDLLENPTDVPVTIRYEVFLRDGGAVQVVVEYLQPSGGTRGLEVTTPWATREMTFEPGSRLVVEATTDDAVGSVLLCAISSREGAWSGGTVGGDLATCRTDYQLGEWPPDDLRGSLIQVR